MVGERSPSVGGAELRQDPVTEKWVVMSSGRAQRPQDYAQVAPAHGHIPEYVDRCSFCNTREFPQNPETLFVPRRGRHWRIRAFPNKFPAFTPLDHVRAWKVGPYTAMEAAGFHEVLTPRAHNGYLFRLSPDDLRLYVSAWRSRYRELMGKPSVAYIQIIENHGRTAGASLEHSHTQLFAIPVLPSDEVLDILEGAERYFRENSVCAYCDLLEFEREVGARVVYENTRFVVFLPFASRMPYEHRILPKEHASGFEQLLDDDLPLFADALGAVARALAAALHDPSYNLVLYSAPCDTEGYVCATDAFAHFHWHAAIFPRLSEWAGFEMATGMEIVNTLPEDAAAALRPHYASATALR